MKQYFKEAVKNVVMVVVIACGMASAALKRAKGGA